MSINHAMLYLLHASEGAEDVSSENTRRQDSVWVNLDAQNYLVAPVHVREVPENVGEIVIDVVGALPVQMEGWNLLLG